MAGIKQFDQEAVVERAMLQFWRAGYGATSIQDLEQTTKLGRGSLYNAFGDKEGLFVAALKRYQDTVGHQRIEQLSNPDAYLAVKNFLNLLVDQMDNPSRPRGCLQTNTSLEFPDVPDTINRMIAERTKGIENTLFTVLERAKLQGSIDQNADTRALARFYLSVAKGVGVLHKVFADAPMLRDAVTVAMNAWPKRKRADRRLAKNQKSSQI
ncbi:MAG: TetR/AcrR family transcriptional regulator [Pseudolabrys sp.]|jgi:TetR/AcrR family transcriptional repressor of nem operon|nr:TetR/AcrR family transcriptional regulator [Pseudolabrys sp.]